MMKLKLGGDTASYGAVRYQQVSGTMVNSDWHEHVKYHFAPFGELRVKSILMMRSGEAQHSVFFWTDVCGGSAYTYS